MKRKKENIHDIIKEKFGTNKRHDERFSNQKYWDKVEASEPPQEMTEANGDNVPESASPYYKNLNYEAELRVQIIKDNLHRLTEKERRAVYLCGIRGLSLQAAAQTLGIKRDAFRDSLERARVKLKKIYRQQTSKKIS